MDYAISETIMLPLLREIGKRLLKEIPLIPKWEGALPPPPKGASGDRTFPVDKKAEEIIFSMLEASGEPLTLISEEAGVVELKGGGRLLLIDPIDGSKNAISGIPFYCTSIAVSSGPKMKDLELSYVINLINGDEFWSGVNDAFLNGKAISTQKDECFSLIAYEAQTPGRDIPAIMPLIGKFQKSRCFGATALDLAYLASGAVSVFVVPSPSRSFDFAGGWHLVRKAGGVITDMEGKSLEGLELGLKKASTILAAGNEALHKKALKALH